MIIRFWLIAAVVRRRRPRAVHRRLHAHLGGPAVIARRPVLVHGLAVAGAATVRALRAARRTTSSPPTTRSTTPSGRWPPSSASSSSSGPTPTGCARWSAASELVVPAPGRARDAPAVRRRRRRRPAGARASWSWPTAGSRSARAGLARCSPSPAPTARRRPRCSPSRCSRPPGSARSPPATPTCRSSRPSTSTSTPSSSSAPASGWRGRRRSAATPRCGSTWRPTTSTGTPAWTAYEAAKARIFTQQRPDDVAIGFADDPVVMAHLERAPGRRRTFAATGRRLPRRRRRARRPAGAAGRRSPSMRRSLPHDLHERPGRRRPDARARAGRRRTPSLPRWRRSPARRTASSWSARPTASAGSTTPRRRHRTPRRSPSGRSTRSC